MAVLDSVVMCISGFLILGLEHQSGTIRQLVGLSLCVYFGEVR